MKLIGHSTAIDLRAAAATAALAMCIGTPIRAQSPSPQCAPALAVTSKLFDAPFHMYMIDSAQTDARLHGGKPTVSESISTGSVYYVMVRGKWIKSPVDIAEMRKDRDTVPNGTFTCSHLRDESVDGQSAAVWRIQRVSESGTEDSDLWISKRDNLVLKSDIHQDVGGAFGKSHIVSRYEYTNVRPPAGVP
jgi:hypothetical protein